MLASLPHQLRRHTKLIILLVVLVLLPLICIVVFPHLLSLTVPPDRLQVFEITEQKAGEGIIISLDEQTIRDYPALEKVLLEGEANRTGRGYNEGDIRLAGEVEYPEKITQATIDLYLIDPATGTRKYFAYAGRYYRVGTVHQD